MKALVIGRPKFQVPPDMAPMVTQGALDWYERYTARFGASRLHKRHRFGGPGSYLISSSMVFAMWIPIPPSGNDSASSSSGSGGT